MLFLKPEHEDTSNTTRKSIMIPTYTYNLSLTKDFQSISIYIYILELANNFLVLVGFPNSDPYLSPLQILEMSLISTKKKELTSDPFMVFRGQPEEEKNANNDQQSQPNSLDSDSDSDCDFNPLITKRRKTRLNQALSDEDVEQILDEQTKAMISNTVMKLLGYMYEIL